MKITKLKAFGDSFVYGSDLLDNNDEDLNPSKLTWTARSAELMGLDYECYARPGVGNNHIAQQVLQHADPESLCIINWTWIDRWEFFDIVENKWTTVRPTGTEDHPLAEIYYKYLQSELQDKWQSLNYVYSTHEYLRRNKIKFVSHIMDELLLDLTHHCPKYIGRLQNDIRDDIQRWPYYTTFLTWSQMNDFDISDNLHPLEEAHEAGANLWQETYESLIK